MNVSRQLVARVIITPLAAGWIKKLRTVHGPLLFHQSGGCCDGSSPMCYPLGDFKLGQVDVLMGTIEETPFYISESQFELWQHTQICIDVVPGRGGGFSLEAPEGIRFLTRSRVFTDEETQTLEKQPPPTRGAV